MTKKFTISLLVTVVFVGLVLFSYSQVVAQPPTDSARIITCQYVGEKLRLEFDDNGQLTAAAWCPTDSSGECLSDSTFEDNPLYPYKGYLRAGDDIRPIQNAELMYWCQGFLGGCLGGNCFPKFP